MHRSFIVRIDKIYAIDAPDVIMGDQMGCIPIGDSYYGDLLKRLDE
ncbi:MAG: hypothetical protein IPK70_00240 [Flavobacteriales bacterium]|nr:hypothetical protein [Flavobacteriales bacterium]